MCHHASAELTERSPDGERRHEEPRRGSDAVRHRHQTERQEEVPYQRTDRERVRTVTAKLADFAEMEQKLERRRQWVVK